MRKAVKQQIIQLIDTILEAHVEIKKSIDSEAFSDARSILADCQDCAVMVGNTIEQFEDDKNDIIIKLEKYCESLYELYVKMDSDIQLESVVIEQLNATIKSVKKDIESQIPVELKVVFMPYKAAMWTSLESIWKAAYKDPECDVKVVVLPYYTLDSEKKPDAMVYESEMFPEYVPITHYEDYELDQEQPDMIFIHNPYDGGNNLTRIPEKYYSYNLKQYTEQLVYSPYGMMGTYNPKKGSFMCCTNAIIVADKVLVQSEKVKQIYISHGIEPNKLLAIGSPKVDAIVESNHKKYAFPVGWEKKLQGRKVFLMNTHLSYFINGYLYKKGNPEKDDYARNCHERIFDYLLNREGCALIWRPHPLLKEMLKSRNLGETLLFVEQLEKRIEESDNAVLDTNGEYDVSFALSNALISTYSSIIPEYMISGKPVYIYQKRYDDDLYRCSPVSYMNNYYIAKKGENATFTGFVEMVLRGEDELHDKRMEDIKEAFSDLNGNIGPKIYQYLKNEWRILS